MTVIRLAKYPQLKNLFFLLMVLSFSFVGRAQKQITQLNEGIWRGIFTIQATEKNPQEVEIPFNFEVKHTKEKGQFFIHLINGEEKIKVEEVFVKGDSIIMNFPVYEKMMKASFTENEMHGVWINPKVKNSEIPFSARFGEDFRFAREQYGRPMKCGGKWKTIFRPGTKRAFDALGEFVQRGSKMTGTFQTEYGDFRYLQGDIVASEIKLSNFDGGHIYLFTAKYNGSDSLLGKFYSGKRAATDWVATRDEKFELRDPDHLTKLKENFSTIDFSIEDEAGNIISPHGKSFENKVRIIQISGTWCPNCMDETKFLVELLKQEKNPDLKVIGLSFERYKDKAKAYKVINTFKTRYNVNYDFIYAGITKDVGKILPMLDNFMCFPTMIVMDKEGEIVKVHTGFYGPATSKYESFKKEFRDFVEKLLAQ